MHALIFLLGAMAILALLENKPKQRSRTEKALNVYVTINVFQTTPPKLDFTGLRGCPETTFPEPHFTGLRGCPSNARTRPGNRQEIESDADQEGAPRCSQP